MDIAAVLLILGSISTVLCQDPSVFITETEPIAIQGVIQVERDHDVTMSCFVENKQEGTYVRWNRVYYDSTGKLQIQKISEDTSVEDNTRNSIEKPTQFTWRLRLKTTQVSDEGNYTCFVYTTRDNRKDANVTVSVAIAPYFDLDRTSSDMTVRAGDNVDLECNATARPHPTIRWTRLGGALLPIGKESHFDSKLGILNIRAEDRGTYRCEAFNTINGEVRKIIRDINVDVRFRPLIQANKAVLSQKKGCRIELQCLVEANPFPAEEGGMMWVKGSTVISRSIGRYKVQYIQGAFNRLIYELIINDVKQEDYGTYRCQVKNSEGTTSETIRLEESSKAENSVKLGRAICGGAAHMQISLATVLLMLLATMMS